MRRNRPHWRQLAGSSRASSARLSFTIVGLRWPPRAPQADAGLKDSASPAPDTPAFVVEGSLVTIKDKVRLNLVAKDASNDALVFSNSAVFGGDTVVTEVDALAGRLAAALAAKVGAAGRSGSVIAVVSPFQAAGDPGKFQALSALVPDTLVTLLSRAQRESGIPRILPFGKYPRRNPAMLSTPR